MNLDKIIPKSPIFIKVNKNTFINYAFIKSFQNQYFVYKMSLKEDKCIKNENKSCISILENFNKGIDIQDKLIESTENGHDNSKTEKFKAGYFSRKNNKLNTSVFNLSKIYSISRRGSISTVCFIDGNQSQFYEPLTFFEKISCIDQTFIRVRRELMVNLSYVSSIQIKNSNQGRHSVLTILFGHEYAISRRRLVQIKKKVLDLSI